MFAIVNSWLQKIKNMMQKTNTQEEHGVTFKTEMIINYYTYRYITFLFFKFSCDLKKGYGHWYVHAQINHNTGCQQVVSKVSLKTSSIQENINIRFLHTPDMHQLPHTPDMHQLPHTPDMHQLPPLDTAWVVAVMKSILGMILSMHVRTILSLNSIMSELIKKIQLLLSRVQHCCDLESRSRSSTLGPPRWPCG